MMQADAPIQPDEAQNERKMAALLGYAEVGLSKPVGGKKSVRVKCLPVRMFAEYAALIEDEPALVEIFTGLTPQQVDELAVDDFVKILQKGHGLNFDPFTEWLKRKAEAKRMTLQAYGIKPAKNETTPEKSSSLSQA